MLDAVLTEGEKRSRKWYFVIALVVNTALMVAVYVKFQAVFEGADDTAIAQFVNGSGGSYDPHLVFSNYILGVIWCFLYRVFPGIAWYSWFQYGLLCLSFTAITYVLMCRIGRVGGFCTSLVVLCFASYEFYVNLQFTKTAGVLTVACVLLILHAVAEAKISWRSLISGFVLAAFAVMYRYKEFYVCLFLLAVGIGFWLLFHLGREVQKGRRARRLLRWIVVFAALVAVSAGLLYVDRQQYTSSRWQAYAEYNETRSDLFDYGLPDYQENKAVYDELGIDENAYNLYSTWNYGDTEKMNVETMQKLIDARGNEAFSFDTVRAMLGEVPQKMLENRIFLSVIAVAVLWILWGRHDAGTHFALILECAAFFGLYLYMFYQGRYLLNRVDTGLWLAFEAMLLWSFRPDPVGRAGILVGEAHGSAEIARITEKYLEEDAEHGDSESEDQGYAADEEIIADRDITGTDLNTENADIDKSEAGAEDGNVLPNKEDQNAMVVDIEDFDYEEAIDEEEPVERRKERSRGFRWFMMAVRVVCIAVVLLFCVQYEYPEWKNHTRGSRSDYTAGLERNADTLLETSADTEHVYISKLGLLSSSESFAPFDVMPKGCLSNVVPLGGWRVGTAQYNDVLVKYGLDTNPYRALITGGNVYLADDDIETTLAYLRTYYDETAQALQVDEINGVIIYQVVTGQ